MPVTDNRVEPLASVTLYGVGAGDGLVTDAGTWRYHVLEHTAKFGSSTRDASGQQKLRVIPEIGLVCREFYVPKDTRLADYSTSGGSWEERRPAVSAPRVYYLVQYSSAANVVWSATSAFRLPADPSFAFRLITMDTPADHNATTYPPYTRLEFGEVWAVSLNRELGTRLLYKHPTAGWQEHTDLPEPTASPIADLSAMTVLVRCQRGKILVSTDFGKTWTICQNVDGTSISVASRQVAFRGQGMAAIMGLHQIKYYSGIYTSAPFRTFVSRDPTATSPTLETVGAGLPAGTSIALADAATGSGPKGIGFTENGRYTVTLTPATPLTKPQEWYTSPCLPAVHLYYPMTRAAAAGTSAIPWDAALLAVDVDKPYELDGATAHLVIRRTPDLDFSGEFRWRKLQITLGHHLSTGGTSTTVVFTGHIRSVAPGQPAFGRATLDVWVDTVTIRAKRTKWDKVRGLPLLAGRTVNAALDMCLAYMGLGTADRSWAAVGDLVSLPLGAPEEPGEWAREDEPVWDTMSRIAAYAGLELGATDAGVWQTIARGAFSAGVDLTLEANPASDANNAVWRARNELDYSDTYSCVLVWGTDAAGGECLAWVRDTPAETNTGSGRFTPWRELHQQRMPGVVTPQILAIAAQGIAREKLPLKTAPDLDLPVRLDITRRMRVRATGLDVGMGDANDYGVLTVRHHYEANGQRLTTTAGLRRIVE